MKKTFVNEAGGIYLIKAGDYTMNELSTLRNTPELKGQILDIPLANSQNAALTLGYFHLQPSVSYEAFFDFIEVKIVTKGTMVVRNAQDEKFVANVGDVLVFMPDTKVIFDGESNGEAIYFKNTAAVPSYLTPGQ